MSIPVACQVYLMFGCELSGSLYYVSGYNGAKLSIKNKWLHTAEAVVLKTFLHLDQFVTLWQTPFVIVMR